MRGGVVVLAAMLTAGTARAEEGHEGAACVTSDDCGALHCIDETCQDLDALVSGKGRRPLPPGQKGMFGDGHDYRMAVVTGDVLASATVPVLILLAANIQGGAAGFLGVASVLPTTLTGPIIHAVNGRAYPAVISFFGWAAVPPSATGLGVLALLAAGIDDAAAAIGVFIGVASAGAGLMTALDWYMARKVTPDAHPGLQWTARIVPLRGGGMASLVGSF